MREYKKSMKTLLNLLLNMVYNLLNICNRCDIIKQKYLYKGGITMRTPFVIEFTGTPEAGKTTSITNVSNALLSIGYKVSVLRESAEKLPKEIPKGIWDANLWMHHQTQAGLIRAKYFKTDIVLVDRGLIDSDFYGKKFLWEKECTEEEYQQFRKLFIEELFPDFVLALIVPPEIAIQRRGGEGRLVNEEYIRNYNKMFLRYYDSLTCPKELIDTSEFSVYEMNQKVLGIIKEALS